MFKEELPDALTVEVLRPLRLPLQAMLRDLRSTLVREACKVLETLATMGAAGILRLVRELMETLVEQIANGNKVIKGYVDECIVVLIDHLKFRSEISMICNVAMTHKSKEGRDGCARYIFQIIRVWSSPYIDSEADTLQKMISKCLEDSSAESRETTRESFAEFVKLFPDRRAAVLQHVGHRTKKLLGGDDVPSSPLAATTTAVPRRVFTGRKASARQRSLSAKPPARNNGGDRRESRDAESLEGLSTSATMEESKRLMKQLAAARPGTARKRRANNTDDSPHGVRTNGPSTPHSATSSTRSSMSVPRARTLSSGGGLRLSPGRTGRTSTSPTSGGRGAIDVRSSGSSQNELEADDLHLALEAGQRIRIMPRKSNASAPGPLENMRGAVHFYGKTKFAQGVWVGIELDAPLGNHSGSIKGETYFTCKDKHGVFVRPGQVEVLEDESDRENQLGLPPPPDANTNVNASSLRTDCSPGSDSPGSETSALTQPNQPQVTSVDDATLLAQHKAHVGQMLALLETEMVMIAEVEASQFFNQQHRRKLLGIKQSQATLVGGMLGLVGRWEPNAPCPSSSAGSTSTEGTA